MLTALETGVKGGVWFSLMDKVYSLRNLLAAYGKVAANGGAAGVDHVTVRCYAAQSGVVIEVKNGDCLEAGELERYLRTARIDALPLEVGRQPGGGIPGDLGKVAEQLSLIGLRTGCAGDLMPGRDLVAVRIDAPASGDARAQAVIPPRTTPHAVDNMLSANAPVRRRTFAFTEYQRAKNSKTDFYITEVSRPDAIIEPYPMHGAPASVVEVEPNSVEEWTILNFTHELHNFHIHQLHFRVLESDDKFVEGRMLDTINVPVASPDANWSPDDPVTPGKVRLLMRFHQNISGEFVFHCHILGHEDRGMMGLVRVVDPGWRQWSNSQSSPEHRH
jgi:uncharacterized cupredoxin-like copper-binding protein